MSSGCCTVPQTFESSWKLPPSFPVPHGFPCSVWLLSQQPVKTSNVRNCKECDLIILEAKIPQASSSYSVWQRTDTSFPWKCKILCCVPMGPLHLGAHVGNADVNIWSVDHLGPGWDSNNCSLCHCECLFNQRSLLDPTLPGQILIWLRCNFLLAIFSL